MKVRRRWRLRRQRRHRQSQLSTRGNITSPKIGYCFSTRRLLQATAIVTSWYGQEQRENHLHVVDSAAVVGGIVWFALMLVTSIFRWYGGLSLFLSFSWQLALSVLEYAGWMDGWMAMHWLSDYLIRPYFSFTKPLGLFTRPRNFRPIAKSEQEKLIIANHATATEHT